MRNTLVKGGRQGRPGFVRRDFELADLNPTAMLVGVDALKTASDALVRIGASLDVVGEVCGEVLIKVGRISPV